MISNNKRCFSANGFSLLPLALRPRLFCTLIVIITITTTLFFTTITLSSGASATSPTLTLTIAEGSNTISLNIVSMNGSNGTFRTSDTTSNNISVSTNNFTGYTLGILAKAANVGDTTHSNALSYTASGTTYTIPSITTAVSQSSYSDDAYAEANSLNNTWGYRPSTLYDSTNDTNVSNTDYLPAPTSTETANQTIIAKTTSANTSGSTDGYNIAIGARVNNDTPPGTYTNTFVITAVANLIPYSITYNQNTTDTVSNMPTPNPQTGNLDVNNTTTITLSSNTPTRSGYAFKGWCTEQVADDAACTGTEYQPSSTYDIDYLTGNNTFTLYARWAEIPTITFKAGSGIETVIVADSSQNYKLFYATSDSDAVFENATAGTTYIVTVVPEANYKLDDTTPWTGDTSGLTDTTLLTTTYTVSTSATLTANGTSGSYSNMKDFTKANCTAATNVTDERDGKSYTVAPIGNYCYMLSNLRLEGGTALTTTTSNVTADTFTLPDQTTWTSSSQNHYCEARMRYIGNEYYYNWYAAKANPTTGLTSSTSCATTTYDNASLGSICPKNWTLPTYNDITAANLWNSGANPGMLATTGYFYSGSQYYVGSSGGWWSSTRSNNGSAGNLSFNGTSAVRLYYLKYVGRSVRCMRSS